MAITDEMLDEMIGTAKTQEDIFGRDGLLNTLSNRLLDRMFDSEMTHHLGYEKHAVEGRNTGNSRNGKTTKTVKTNHGELTLTVPRDRSSNFEPILIEKRQNRLKVVDDQILALYGLGMTVRDI